MLTIMDSIPCPRFYKPSNEYNFSSSHSDARRGTLKTKIKRPNNIQQVHKLSNIVCSDKPRPPAKRRPPTWWGHFFSEIQQHSLRFWICKLASTLLCLLPIRQHPLSFWGANLVWISMENPWWWKLECLFQTSLRQSRAHATASNFVCSSFRFF